MASHAQKKPPVLKTIKLTAATEPPPEAVFLRLPSVVSEPQHKPPQRPARAEHHLDPPRRLWPFLARLKGIPAARLPQKSRGTERANRMDPLPSLLTAKNDEAGRVVLTSRWRLQKAYTTAGKHNANPEGLA
jgi:hypothetical protein